MATASPMAKGSGLVRTVKRQTGQGSDEITCPDPRDPIVAVCSDSSTGDSDRQSLCPGGFGGITLNSENITASQSCSWDVSDRRNPGDPESFTIINFFAFVSLPGNQLCLRIWRLLGLQLGQQHGMSRLEQMVLVTIKS
ncbi:hypothetical protein CEP52_010830 [Fusarium oligoseptatum]|uniref:Uncharacterized protein n=1 Tax=Fusarium oligoseptatum TaxID=2604345 RepID=A0A428T655_9HYPO|nr:hypothetical protein CEP52_010830 [Fusarium oligoseptatum]